MTLKLGRTWTIPAGAGFACESLVAGGALCDRARADDLADAYQGRSVQIDFDFIDHRLIIRMSDGRQ